MDALAQSEASSREANLQRALRVEYFTVAWNSMEALVGLVAGILAGSVALVGFALDSIAEGSSGVILLWRFKAEGGGAKSEDVERRAIRLVAVAFFALAAYIGVRAIVNLVTQARPEESPAGIALAIVSLVVMPLLAKQKRAVARSLDSRALQADSSQTMLCTYLSAVLLMGLLANAVLGWWWADSLAALGIAALAANEGRELWTTEDVCCT